MGNWHSRKIFLKRLSGLRCYNSRVPRIRKDLVCISPVLGKIFNEFHFDKFIFFSDFCWYLLSEMIVSEYDGRKILMKILDFSY